MMSPVQTERLFAAHASLCQTLTALEELKGEHTEAKKNREEREQALLVAIGAAREKHPDGEVPKDEQKSIFKIQQDYIRASNSWNLKDREKRRLDDLSKKLTERVLNMVKEAREGPDLFGAAAGGSEEDKLAWRKVELADLVDSLMAGPLKESELFTIGDFLTAWAQRDTERLVKEKKLDAHLVDFVAVKVVHFLKSKKLESEIPGSMVKASANVGKIGDDALKAAKPAETGGVDLMKPTPGGNSVVAGNFSGYSTWTSICEDPFFSEGMEPAHLKKALEGVQAWGGITPLSFLDETARTWKRLKSEGEPSEKSATAALPKIPAKLKARMADVIAVIATQDDKVGQKVRALATINIDAFLVFAGGKDSDLNRTAVELEKIEQGKDKEWEEAKAGAGKKKPGKKKAPKSA